MQNTQMDRPAILLRSKDIQIKFGNISGADSVYPSDAW